MIIESVAKLEASPYVALSPKDESDRADFYLQSPLAEELIPTMYPPPPFSIDSSLDADLFRSYPFDEADAVHKLIEENVQAVWTIANLSAKSFSVFSHCSGKKFELKATFHSGIQEIRVKSCEAIKAIKIIFKVTYILPRVPGTFLYVKPRKDTSEDNVQLLMHEAKIAEILRNLPHMLTVCRVPKNKSPETLKALGAAWYPCGNLWQYLENYVSWQVPQSVYEKNRLLLYQTAIAEQICLGLSGIHGRGLVHNDLKTENILVARTPGGDITLICDFDRTVPEGTILEKPETTRSYTPPEAWVKEGIVSRGRDLWGLGITLFELRYRLTNNPYHTFVRLQKTDEYFEDEENYPFIRRKWIELRESIVSALSNQDFYDKIILELLSIDPKDRPTAESLSWALEGHKRALVFVISSERRTL